MQGRDFSVEYWAGEIERAASNVVDSVSRALNNVADSVSRAPSNVVDSASRAPSNKRSQTYHFPQKALYRNMGSLDEHYNDTIEPRPPERHYYVGRLDGTTVTIREYVRGWRFDHLKRLGAQASGSYAP